jgi:hypothetical protein
MDTRFQHQDNVLLFYAFTCESRFAIIGVSDEISTESSFILALKELKDDVLFLVASQVYYRVGS